MTNINMSAAAERPTRPREILKGQGHKTILSYQEIEPFRMMMQEFLNSGRDYDIANQASPEGISVGTIYPSKTQGEVVVEPNDQFSLTSYFERALSYLSETDLSAHDDINNYLEQGGKIVLIRRTKPSAAFKKALETHSETYSRGFIQITERLLAKQSDEVVNGKTDGVQLEEEASLKDLRELAGKSIHFYAITPTSRFGDDSKPQVSTDISEAVERLNALVEPQEFQYTTDITGSELKRKETNLALALVGMSFALPFGLDEIKGAFSEQASMITAQMTGELFTMLVSAGDRLAHLKMPYLSWVFGQAGLNFSRLPKPMQIKFMRAAGDFFREKKDLRNRLLVLLANFAVAYGLSDWSVQSHDFTPFLAIPFINTSIINLYEICFERRKKAKNLLEEKPYLEKEVFNLFPKKLHKLVGKNPDLALAISDFVNNRAALGSWLGTLLSLGLIPWVGKLPDSLLESLSALGLENGVAALTAFISRLQDRPWEKINRLTQS